MIFQDKIKEWMEKTFQWISNTGLRDNPYSSKTRAYRFLEEAIELCQAEGMKWGECNEILAYVYARPIGKINQEIGGVMVTLSAYCNSKNLDMVTEGWREFYRIDTDEMREKIREKQKTKPNGLPTPATERK